ncbi:MAG TPA: carboxypeptidase regulatory-like domain-containing protein [Ardenticatenaceae bacterium]|jgi:hypothetical protein
MKIRLALLALVITSALVALLALSTTPQPAHADESGARPTPTPDRPLDAQALSPDSATAPEADLPDLVITDIRILPNPPVINRPVTVEVTIANSGTLPLPAGNNFFVDLYINPPALPGICSTGNYSWSVQATSLAEGPVTLRVTFAPGTPAYPALFEDVGLVRFWAQVDTCGNVVENREDNNRRATAVDFTTNSNWLQASHEDFQTGFSSALDLTEESGVLQNGTGWFEEPRFPRPEEDNSDWPTNPARPWDSPNFYNPDRHIHSDNLPDNYPQSQLGRWNPPDQENVDVEVGFIPDMLFAVWEDARNGDLNDRDIYFSRSLNSGRSWSLPTRINQDAVGNGRNQLNPQLVIDYEARRLFIFWEDNRLGTSGYDIFFARSLDNGWTWEEPTESNPVNDFNVNPAADQINVTAAAFNEWTCDDEGENCGPGPTHLFVAWEDYRNDNSDIFSEWSSDGGDSWLRIADDDPTTVDANIWVQPDPRTNAAAFEQRNPHLHLDQSSATALINYCERPTEDEESESIHRYVQNPLPRVFIVWEDERDIKSGDPTNIYYTRGEFSYDPDLPFKAECNTPPDFWEEWARSNLPLYRFEDDHVRVNTDEGTATQSNPVIGFTQNSFLSAPPYTASFTDTITGTNPINPDEVVDVVVSFSCDVRFPTEEMVVDWQDNRDGTFDIWSANLFDDIRDEPVFLPAGPLTVEPAEFEYLYDLDRTEDFERAKQRCITESERDLDRPEVPRNEDPYTPQPPEYYELALPETNIKINDWVTFTPKEQCRVDEPTGDYLREPSEQTLPDLQVLPYRSDINLAKEDIEETFEVTLFWSAWADDRAYDESNRDIFLRPTLRRDNSRAITVVSEEDPDVRLALQVVQDNVKNQIMIRQQDLYEDYLPASVDQSNPSIAFRSFDSSFNFDENDYFYVGWDDNRNANPLIGFEGNRDVFAARMIVTDVLTTTAGFELYPTRTATYISSVFDAGGEVTWYDIEWLGDISADGVVSLQTRFGINPNQPEPPQENIAANGWTQWTGIGGTGGVYTGPGQHITGPDGERFPKSYYIQYRVNFNPLGLGQQGISCLTEIKLNFEPTVYETYLPMLLRNTQPSGQGTIEGTVTNAATGDPLGAAQVCEVTTNQCTTSDFNGRYSLPVPAGERQVRATLAGYLPAEQSVTVGTGPPVTVNFQLSSGTGTVGGQVVSAVTGGPLGGARICLADTDQCATSGTDGRYDLTNVPAGTQRLRVSLSGYVPLDQSVTVTGGAAATLNFALSPVLPAGEMRVVLTWGERPSDLDSHLWLPAATPAHIFWVEQGRCDAFPHACLDVDDVTSYGPETTTIRQRHNGTYVYAIYQYTTNGPLTASGARIQVYTSSGLVAEYTVPTGGDGRWWHVFDMDGATGNITPRNIITNTSPGPYDPDPRLLTNGTERAKE